MRAVIAGEVVVDELSHLVGWNERALHVRVGPDPEAQTGRHGQREQSRRNPPSSCAVDRDREDDREEPGDLAPGRRPRADYGGAGGSDQTRETRDQDRVR